MEYGFGDVFLYDGTAQASDSCRNGWEDFVLSVFYEISMAYIRATRGGRPHGDDSTACPPRMGTPSARRPRPARGRTCAPSDGPLRQWAAASYINGATPHYRPPKVP